MSSKHNILEDFIEEVNFVRASVKEAFLRSQNSNDWEEEYSFFFSKDLDGYRKDLEALKESVENSRKTAQLLKIISLGVSVVLGALLLIIGFLDGSSLLWTLFGIAVGLGVIVILLRIKLSSGYESNIPFTSLHFYKQKALYNALKDLELNIESLRQLMFKS